MSNCCINNCTSIKSKGCELIKTKRVLCEKSHKFEYSVEAMPLDDCTKEWDAATWEGDVTVFPSGCELEVVGDKYQVTIGAIHIQENLCITGTGFPTPTECPELCFSEGFTTAEEVVTFQKCIVDETLNPPPQCQIYCLTVTPHITIEPGMTDEDPATIAQSFDIEVVIKIDQEVQLLVQLCTKPAIKIPVKSY